MVCQDNCPPLTKCYAVLFLWITIITGCWSAGIRVARSPGVTVPHFVTSNVLGERNHPPNPANSPDYDSLLEIVNGDFGVKSAVVKAATEEPVYKGSGTKILPLYIPKGAIPIKLARIARSGVGTSSLRIPLRRPRVQSSITSRRQGGPRRPNPPPPTPPSSFLRGWGRRISPKAESRLGLQLGDSKTSASRQQSHTLKVPDAKRIRNNSSQSIRNDSNSSTTASPSSPTTTTPPTPTTEASSPVPQPSVVSPGQFIRNNRNLTVSTTTENSAVNDTRSQPEKSDDDISSARKDALSRKESLQLRNKSDLSKKPLKVGRVNGRFPFTRPTSDGRNSPIRNSRTSTTEPSLFKDESEDDDVHESKKIVPNRKSSLQRIRQTILSRNNGPNANKKETPSRNAEQTPTRNSSSKTRIQFPTRPTTPKSDDPDDGESKTDSENIPKESDKLRLPVSPFEISKGLKVDVTTERSLESLASRPTSAAFVKKPIVTSPSVPIPVRRRRPLRTRLPQAESVNSGVNLPVFSTTPSTIKPSTRPSKARSSTTSTPVSSTTSPATFKPTFTPLKTLFSTTTTIRPSPKSPSSTTTSTIRRIHEFFKIPSNVESVKKTRLPYLSTTSKPSTKPTTSTVSSTVGPLTTPQSLLYPTRYWTKNSNRKGLLPVHPARRAPGSKPVPPSSKSAAEIVISSLSEVMRDVPPDDMDKVKKIASDLDALNKKLSERGILIIHAEVDGVILNLRNQTTIATRNPQSSFVRQIEQQRENDSLHESEKESLQPQILSVGDDTSTTIYTPSDKLAYDVLANSGELKDPHDRLVYDIASEKINEVYTTALDKAANLTTNKPNMQPETPGPIISISSSEVSTEKYDGVGTVSSSTERKITEVESDYSDLISATPTLPSSTTTRSRTPAVPIANKPLPTDHLLEIDFIADLSAENQAESAEMPLDSYQGATKSKIESTLTADSPSLLNSTHINLVLKSEETQEVEEDPIEDYIEADYVEELKTTTNSSSVYLVGIVGIFPLAGLAAYVVRKYLRGDSHKKALPESEERPDGYTPPTHHHIRTHSLVPPPLPTDLPPHKGQSSPCGSDSADSGVPPSLLSASPWEFSRSKLKLVSILGEGNFGVVWKAEARGFCDYSSGGSTVLVAVKRVKECAGTKEKCDLLRELSVMQLLGPHPNVVSLLGCCTQTEPHLVIMEYVMFGKLLTFLRDHRTRHNYFNFSSDTAALTSRDLTRFACQVATGCDYLQSRGIIHRDLAARNILVDHNKVCKIADFGMARSIQDIGSDIYEQKSKGALPIRWMAPESLYMNIFTHKSDVWSFGILCWEIVTLGSTPYPGLTAREVMRQVTEGFRLERPDHCRPELYRLFSTCWLQDLNKRPSFHQLKLELSTLLEHETGYIDLENFPEDDYFSMHQNNEEKL